MFQLTGFYLTVCLLSGEPADLLDPGWQIKKAAEDCKFTEGPAVDGEGSFYFSDGPNDRIMRSLATARSRSFASRADGPMG